MLKIKMYLNRLICYIRGHQRCYWSNDKVKAEGAMGGVFTPYLCKRCGYNAHKFPYPLLSTEKVDK